MTVEIVSVETFRLQKYSTSLITILEFEFFVLIPTFAPKIIGRPPVLRALAVLHGPGIGIFFIALMDLVRGPFGVFHRRAFAFHE